jgi:four helix bundle protein
MVTSLAKTLPAGTPPKLRGQLMTAANSISANIAEGVGRGTAGEKGHFFRIARGSLEEAQTYLRICVSTSLIDQTVFHRPWNRSVVINHMLSSLIDRVDRMR